VSERITDEERRLQEMGDADLLDDQAAVRQLGTAFLLRASALKSQIGEKGVEYDFPLTIGTVLLRTYAEARGIDPSDQRRTMDQLTELLKVFYSDVKIVRARKAEPDG